MENETKAALLKQKYTIISETEVRDKQNKSYFPLKSNNQREAIRMMCATCMGYNTRLPKDRIPLTDIEECRQPMCPLYEHRLNRR